MRIMLTSGDTAINKIDQGRFETSVTEISDAAEIVDKHVLPQETKSMDKIYDRRNKRHLKRDNYDPVRSGWVRKCQEK